MGERMQGIDSNEMNVLNNIRDKEEKNLKNLLSRKSFDTSELDEIMNPDLY